MYDNNSVNMAENKNTNFNDTSEIEKIRVCVIGAGAAGLCAIRHLADDLHIFEPVVFEQSNAIGGTWVYTDNIGFYNGLPIHTSMYKNLTTNIPLKLMNFPDFQHMDQSQPSCGTHEQVLKYLQDYAEHFKLHQFIQLNTKVECVSPILRDNDWKKTTWKVIVKNLKTQVIEDKYFDAVMICNGHFSEPVIPLIHGIETFTGETMHSHDYRTPEKYSNKTVVVLGAGPSGIDIGIEISHSAKHVYLCHNGPRLISALPSNMIEKLGLVSIKGNEFQLGDNTAVTDVDALLYCTGYKYSYSFLDEMCKVQVINYNHVTPLFKHLINIQHPKMAILGIPKQVIPFLMFHVQAQYCLNLFRGRVNLPSVEKMIEDSNMHQRKYPHTFEDNMGQWEYNDYLATEAGVDKLPEFYKNGYIKWSMFRKTNLMTFKNSRIDIDADGKTVRFTT